jgi:hypothetical protein
MEEERKVFEMAHQVIFVWAPKMIRAGQVRIFFPHTETVIAKVKPQLSHRPPATGRPTTRALAPPATSRAYCRLPGLLRLVKVAIGKKENRAAAFLGRITASKTPEILELAAVSLKKTNSCTSTSSFPCPPRLPCLDCVQALPD